MTTNELETITAAQLRRILFFVQGDDYQLAALTQDAIIEAGLMW